jgi:C_GCAxxG_C_C family probable redox protein
LTVTAHPADPPAVEIRCVELVEQGYCCAEAVLMAVAEYRGIESPLIPAIATGWCTGLAGTEGPCGALAGGILALNMVLGRRGPQDSREANYRAVQELKARFERDFGATGCTELLGCNPGTTVGRVVFGLKGLKRKCRGFAGTAARMAAELAGPRDKAGG